VEIIFIYGLIPLFGPFVILAIIYGGEEEHNFSQSTQEKITVVCLSIPTGGLFSGLSFWIANYLGVLRGFNFNSLESEIVYASKDSLILILLVIPLTISLVPPSISYFYNKRKITRENLGSILIERGQEFENEHLLVDACKKYAAAIQANLKLKSAEKTRRSLEFYIRVARTMICSAVLCGSNDYLAQLTHLQRKLRTKLTKYDSSDDFVDLDSSLQCAIIGNFDSIYDLCLQIDEIRDRFVKTTKEEGRVEIARLAEKLGYTLESTNRLVEKSLEMKILDGALSKDRKVFATMQYLRKRLTSELERDH
jgi:hypothetical protein